MATKQHSSAKNTCKPIRSFSKRSDWAAWMNGADPEWLCEREAGQLAEVFDGFFPAWLIESEPWRPVNAGRFQCFRRDVMGITVAQCAAYLRVSPMMISRWERGSSAVPFSAFETLRLQYCSAAQRLSHKCWDGWFINRQTGELVCPDIGRLAVKPEEIKTLPLLYGQVSGFRDELAKQSNRVAELEAENITLRNGTNARQVAAELEAMRERITGLLNTFHTAEIIKFNQPAEELRRAS